MVSCFDIAQYILCKAKAEDMSDDTSNLKLQKLVYYCQGFHLAINDTPFFKEKIIAWQHGPVVKELYQACSPYGAGLIEDIEKGAINNLSPEQRGLIDEVYEEYGQFSAWKLRNMTHKEEPWKSTMINGCISNNKMKSFFKEQLIN